MLRRILRLQPVTRAGAQRRGRKGDANVAGNIPNWQRFGIAIPATLVAALLVAAVSHWTALETAPLQILMLAVVVAAYVGGGGPGILATAICTAVTAFFFLAPRFSFSIEDVAEQIRLAVFVVVGLVISMLAGSIHRFRRSADRARQRAYETERAQNETIRAAAERFRLILDSAYDAFVAVDLENKVVEWNPQAERMFGWSRAEVMGNCLAELIVPLRYRDAHLKGIAQYLATGEGPVLNRRIQLEALRKDGTEVPVELTISPAGLGDHRFFAAFIHDISERLAAEKKIRQLSRANELILNFAGEGIYGLDINGTVTFVNPAAVRMTGYPPEETLGKSQHELVHHTKPDGDPYPREQCPIHATLRDGQLHHSAEDVFWRRDGTSFPVEFTAAPIQEEGKLVGAVVVFSDITQRREAEAMVEEQRKELERSNAELQQFAYVASHDLQEPLRMVASYTQLLSRRYKGKLGPEADEFIHFAVDGAQRMQVLINDLLAYSRVGTRGRAFEPVDLNEVLEVVKANLKVAIEESNVQIVTTGELPTVEGDRTQLVQLMQNLVGNAIKFRRPDAPPRVEIGAARDASSSPPAVWHFTVKDNGIGIDHEHHDRIFVIFQRLHTREHYQGTGIGLAVCRKIVERHEGKIWVESHEGEGSTFHFTIPERQDEQSAKVMTTTTTTNRTQEKLEAHS
ncbi:MAG TPA: PAS domain S-box protein [Tepidisphaeraceae bacterium]|nr:PAS domain S-box protein [Tepidisphaeraceae bacterium]